ITNPVCNSISADTMFAKFLIRADVDLGNDTALCPHPLWLDAGNPGYTYRWNTGDTTQVIKITSDGMFKVDVSVHGDCVESDSVDVIVWHEETFFMPNAFSPNGDAVNGSFMPVGRYFLSGEMTIYDRWGRVMYETKNLNKGWDGSLNGSPAPQGTYIYYVSGT